MYEITSFDCSRIAQDLQIRKVQVEAVVQLFDEGNTVPFITRYRKERTGGLNEEVIRRIQDRVTNLRALADRKRTVLKSIAFQGKLSDALTQAIAPGTRLSFGDFTVAQGEQDDRFYVKHITAQWDERHDQRVSSNRLDEILTSLTELNATYPDIVAFLRLANERQCVNFPIATWTTLEVPMQTLIDAGRGLK